MIDRDISNDEVRRLLREILHEGGALLTTHRLLMKLRALSELECEGTWTEAEQADEIARIIATYRHTGELAYTGSSRPQAFLEEPPERCFT